MVNKLIIFALSIIVMIQGHSTCIFPDVQGANKVAGQFEFKDGAVVIQDRTLTIEKWMVIQ